MAIALTNYRLFFLNNCLRFFTPPLALAYATKRFLLPNLNIFFTVLLYIASVPAYWTVKTQYDILVKKSAAAKAGATLAPQYQGKWPGNVDLMVRLAYHFDNSYIGQAFADIFDELGSDTINLRMLWEDQILTRDHHVMQSVLATQFDSFCKGPLMKGRLFGLFGDGIFNNDGEVWKQHRAMTRPFFARERVQDFELFDRYSDKVLNIFRSRAIAGESVDVQDVFGRFTLDAAGEFLFGTTELNTLDLPLPLPGQAKLGVKGSAAEGEYGGFVKAFEDVQLLLPMRARYSRYLWPILELWTDKSKAPNKIIDDWVRPLIQKAVDEKEAKGKKGSDESASLTDHLVMTLDDKQVIRDELMNILLAARDTTASLLSFLLYMFTLHPDVTARLREEILQKCPSGPPTYDDVRGMKYLRACLNETLRLFPPVPINERASSKPSVLPAMWKGKKIYMPGPDVALIYSDFLMQRRTDLWGPDAAEFDPSRWIDPDRLKEISSDPFRFIPFNAGPRICLGQNFAYNEASFVVVRLLQAFEGFELRQKEDAPLGSLPLTEKWKGRGGRNEMEKVWPRNAVTLYSKGGMWIQMIPAKTEA